MTGTITNGAAGTATITQNGGTLRFNTLTKAAGTFNYDWNAGTIQNNPGVNLSDTNLPINALTAGTHTVAVDAGRTATFAGPAVLSGAGGLTKTGDGTLISKALTPTPAPPPSMAARCWSPDRWTSSRPSSPWPAARPWAGRPSTGP